MKTKADLYKNIKEEAERYLSKDFDYKIVEGVVRMLETTVDTTLTEFIEALDLNVKHPDRRGNPEYRPDTYTLGYTNCIREKRAVVEKFMGKEAK